MKKNMFSFCIGIGFIVFGCVLIFLPNLVYSWILDLSLLYCFIQILYLCYLIFKERRWIDVLYAILTLGFFIILDLHAHFPEWIIRVSFGAYCLLVSSATLMQFIINVRYHIEHRLFLCFYWIVYAILGLFLLFTPNFNTDLLLRFFGLYFILLGLRNAHDWYDMNNVDVKYQWSRKFRLMLPPQICVLLPDWSLSIINKKIEEGKEFSLTKRKTKEDTLLKVMVHVGPQGFQKIGHISFAYDNMVYSYGNYDASTYHLSQTLGEGVYFNVEMQTYIENMNEIEKNSVFEYGIRISDKQKERIEQKLEDLKANSYRWYCPIEANDGYDDFKTYESDYASRLHYRTHAKFYKIRSGKFKAYWALGDNCATFTDIVLGTLGSDVLSIRGITSPGTYFDYLEKEYSKPNSPVIYRTIHLRK